MRTYFTRPESRLTLLFTYFGQFLSHDLSLTPEEKLERCCSDRGGKGIIMMWEFVVLIVI